MVSMDSMTHVNIQYYNSVSQYIMLSNWPSRGSHVDETGKGFAVKRLQTLSQKLASCCMLTLAL